MFTTIAQFVRRCLAGGQVSSVGTPETPDDQMWFRLDSKHGVVPLRHPGGPAVPLAEASERSGWTVSGLRQFWRVVTNLADHAPRGEWVPDLTPSDRMRFRAYGGKPVPVMPAEYQGEALDVGEAVQATGWPARGLVDLWRDAAGEGCGGGRADGLRPVAAQPTEPAVDEPAIGVGPEAPSRGEFRVRVLGQTVPVQIWPANQLRADGEKADVYADGYDRRIVIDANIPRERRLELLLYGAYRYWRLFIDLPTTQDKEADLFAAVAEPILMDVMAQGVEALMALEPASEKGGDHV